MKKIRLFILVAILALVVPFGFMAQPTEASTNSTEDKDQSTRVSTNSTEDTTQPPEENTDAPKETVQSKEKTTKLTKEPAEDTVNFKDNNLAQAIRDELGLTGDIPQSELSNLDSLWLSGKNISDLSGLENLTSLKTLYLSGNHISDLSPLSKLTQLESLDISSNDISDLSGLENLTGLKTLRLSGNHISGLSTIAGLTNLTYLSLDNNNINDIGKLKNMKKLESLNVSKNNISNVSVLSKLSNLENVNVKGNDLNLNQGTPSLNIIQSLIEKGLTVSYDNMIALKTKKVSKNAITVEWNVSKSFLNYPTFRVQLLLDGKVIKEYSDLKTVDHTFTGLTEGKEYEIGLHVIYATKDMGGMIPSSLTVKAEDVKTSKQVVAKPAIGGHTATISYGNINAVQKNGTLAIDLKNYKEDQVNVQLTSEQIKMLQEKNIAVEINRGDASASIPTSLLGEGKNVSIVVEKQKPVKNALSSTYDFTIKTEKGTISKFSEPVTLTFKVDPSDVTNPDNVKVWYFNPETKEWEKIGGTYSNGVVTAETNHFSTYTVFEKEEASVGSVTGTKSGTASESGTGSGDRLPDTSTNAMNFMLIGGLFILLAITLLWFQKRRETK